MSKQIHYKEVLCEECRKHPSAFYIRIIISPVAAEDDDEDDEEDGDDDDDDDDDDCEDPCMATQ